MVDTSDGSCFCWGPQCVPRAFWALGAIGSVTKLCHMYTIVLEDVLRIPIIRWNTLKPGMTPRLPLNYTTSQHPVQVCHQL